ncbi:hypothetical protein [Singulisphaera sp. PoT]|uniref:hypothetical protein n=1 Tax=Singulisphaera sp. PoT TaxID=3411797 RepID=UPI003BF52ADA
MEQRIPQVGEPVVIEDEYCHSGVTVIVGVLKPDKPDSPVIVRPYPGVLRDFSKPMPFSPYPRRNHWSWPVDGQKYDEPDRSMKVELTPPRR